MPTGRSVTGGAPMHGDFRNAEGLGALLLAVMGYYPTSLAVAGSKGFRRGARVPLGRPPLCLMLSTSPIAA